MNKFEVGDYFSPHSYELDTKTSSVYRVEKVTQESWGETIHFYDDVGDLRTWSIRRVVKIEPVEEPSKSLEQINQERYESGLSVWGIDLSHLPPEDHPVNLPTGLEVRKGSLKYREDLAPTGFYTPLIDNTLVPAEPINYGGQSMEGLFASEPEPEQFVILELYSMKEILEMNPEACFGQFGDMFKSPHDRDLGEDEPRLDATDLQFLGTTVRDIDCNEIPDWAIRRNLGR